MFLGLLTHLKTFFCVCGVFLNSLRSCLARWSQRQTAEGVKPQTMWTCRGAGGDSGGESCKRRGEISHHFSSEQTRSQSNNDVMLMCNTRRGFLFNFQKRFCLVVSFFNQIRIKILAASSVKLSVSL